MSEKKYRFDYTDALFWIGLLLMVIWVIGKLTGLIHSPEWIEQLPIIGAIVAILSIGLKAGRILQKLDYVIEKVDSFERITKDHEKHITIIETKIGVM